jgi:hypothetical protein
MLRRRRWQLRRIKLDVVHVLALRRVELHVSLMAHRKRRISISCASILVLNFIASVEPAPAICVLPGIAAKSYILDRAVFASL